MLSKISPNNQELDSIEIMSEQRKFLLEISAAKIEKLAGALERNWIIHLVLAGVGLAFIFNIGGLPVVIANYYGLDRFNIQPAALIILPILLYYFMKFGQQLTSFLASRKLYDSLFDSFFSGSVDDIDVTPLRNTTSFFEVFYSPRSFGGRGPLVFTYMLITTAVFSVTQASALFLFAIAYGFGPWSIMVLTVSTLVFLLLYWAFWNANKKLPWASFVTFTTAGEVIVLLVLFSVFRPS